MVATTPAIANDYGICTADLLAAGLEVAAVTEACASAFAPMAVSSCVLTVTEVAAISPTVALAACSRDRRPDEVASCVTTIHTDLTVTDALAVLDTCHRSILPLRFADCVVGVSAAANLTTEASLNTCIAAGYRPENVAPTFIFAP